MKAEFEITDYLKEEEIRYLIAEAIREEVVKDFDLNEMIKDCINDYIKEIVNNDYKEYIKTLIKPRIDKSIEKIDKYDLFRNGDIYSSKGVAYDMLVEESEKARPVLNKRLNDFLNNYSFEDISEDFIMDSIYCLIDKKLFTKKQD